MQRGSRSIGPEKDPNSLAWDASSLHPKALAALWMNLQAQYDLDRAEDEIGETIRAEVRARVTA